MQVMWINRASSRAFVHSMSQVEETEKELVRELEREGVRWQLPFERGYLAGLLEDEEAVAPSLIFFRKQQE